MNIVLACDNNFSPYAAEVIISVLNHDKNVTFYLLTDNLNEGNAMLMKRMTSQNGGVLHIIHVDNKLFKDFPMPKGDGIKHIGISTYFRLFVPILLPKSLDKLIYLDCDIVVRHSLVPLYEMDISDYYLGAVYHTDDLSIQNGAFNRLNIPINQGYFNAGVLLVNLKKWREDDIYNKCITFLHTHTDKILNHDQDVLNAVCGYRTKLLDCTWNCTNSFFYNSFLMKKDRISKIYQKTVNDTIKDPAIVHFAFRPKPWEVICVHPFRKDFRYNLRQTPYKGAKLKWPSLHDFIQYFLKPQLMGYGRYRH